MVATQPSLPTIYFSTSGSVLYAIVQQFSVIRVLVAHMAASDVPGSSTSSRSADLQLLSDHSSGSEFPATQQQKRETITNSFQKLTQRYDSERERVL